MSRPSVAIVIPWRLSPGRRRHLAVACAALTSALREAVADRGIVPWDSGHDPFNRAASRNGGVSARPADVLVVCDADAIVEPEPVRAAVAAADDGKLHLPYTTCRLLSFAGSEHVHAGANPADVETAAVKPNSVGGCVVVSHETWRAAGGWDERFTGWGFEDIAFWASVDTLFGTVRHEGTLHDLWHPDGRDYGSARYRAGMALCDRYTDAHGDSDAIRALIAERP